MRSISIAEALTTIRSGQEFSCVYVRATKNRGSLKTIEKCISGHNYKKFTPQQRKLYEKKQKWGKHSLNGTIPCIDLTNDEQLTLLISHIIYFNNQKVIH